MTEAMRDAVVDCLRRHEALSGSIRVLMEHCCLDLREISGPAMAASVPAAVTAP